jgi:hypothetical protein
VAHSAKAVQSQADLPDYLLEQYLMDLVPEPQLRSIEDHLLVCDECLTRFTSIEQQHSGLKRQ